MKKLIALLISVFCLAFTCKKSSYSKFTQREFKIDTIKSTDKKTRLQIFLTIPISKITNLDLLVRKDILNDKEAFESEINERINENDVEMTEIGSDYSCVLENVFEDKTFISYNFINSQYFGGSAHGMSRYKCYNYDIKKGKCINFNDYFSLKTKQDTLSFLNLLTKRINREAVEVNNLEGIKFNIRKDSISFNFDDYEIASYSEGLIQVRVSKREVQNLINSNYR